MKKMNDLIERNYLIEKFSDTGPPSLSEMGKGYDLGIAAALRVVKNAPSVNMWIPIENSLPEIGYNVLVTRQTESNARYIRIASRQDGCWMDSTDEYGKPNPHPVIAWMPMPNAYEQHNNMIGD